MGDMSNNLEQHTEVLEKAIKIAENCALAYKKAKPETKQLFNQAFFKKVFVKDKKIEGVKYTDLFGTLLSKSSSKKELVDAAVRNLNFSILDQLSKPVKKISA